MITLNEDQSMAVKALVLAFKACKAENLHESFVLDHMFSSVPGAVSGELHSYRRTFWMRNSCGAVQDAVLGSQEER
jgi:hypothetical protein